MFGRRVKPGGPSNTPRPEPRVQREAEPTPAPLKKEEVAPQKHDLVPKERETRLEILQKQYDKEKTKLKRLYSLYADGNDTVLEMIQESESKLSETKEQLDREAENTEYTQKKEYVYEKIKRLADVWDRIDKPDKNKILKSIISKIVIVNGNVEIQLKRF